LYAEQVNKAAQASAELAHAANGNFNKLQRPASTPCMPDAVPNWHWLTRRHGSAGRAGAPRPGREQTALLKLPERLPDLPDQARTATELTPRPCSSD
jgi:hypothetical protein